MVACGVTCVTRVESMWIGARSVWMGCGGDGCGAGVGGVRAGCARAGVSARKCPKLRAGGTDGQADERIGGDVGHCLRTGGSIGQEVAGTPVGEQPRHRGP